MTEGTGVTVHRLGGAAADAEWIDQAYRAHWGELCGYLTRVFGSGPPEPEDIAQSAFAKLAEQRHEAIANTRAYLFATARNAVADYHRKSQRQAAYGRDLLALHDENPASTIDAEQVALSQEQLALVLATVERMPESQRRVFLLSRVEGLSIKAIAEREGASVDAIQRKVARAAAKCLMAMQQAEQSDERTQP